MNQKRNRSILLSLLLLVVVILIIYVSSLKPEVLQHILSSLLGRS